MTLNSGAVFNNQPGATFNTSSDSSWLGGASVTFNNSGTVTKLAGTGTSTFNLAFNNSGTLSVNTGTINLNAGGNSSGQFQGAGTLSLVGTHTLTGISSVTVSNVNFGGDVTMSGTYNVSGSTTASAGNINFLPASTVLGVGSTLSIVGSGAVLNFSSGDAISATTFNLSLGVLDGSDTLTVTGAANWSSGTMQGSGTTVIALGATLSITTKAARCFPAERWTTSGRQTGPAPFRRPPLPPLSRTEVAPTSTRKEMCPGRAATWSPLTIWAS